jgi:hypothetical protein
MSFRPFLCCACAVKSANDPRRTPLKPRNLCLPLIVVCLFAFTITGCKSKSAALVGTYSIEDNGQLKQFARITRYGDKFLISEKYEVQWLAPDEVAPVDGDDIERIVNTPVTGISTSLGNRRVAIVQVPVGWKSGAFESKTGYWLASSLGPVELHKN